MNLNYDCIRDILIFIQDNQKYNEQTGRLEQFFSNKLSENESLTANYEKDQIKYCIEKMCDNDFLAYEPPKYVRDSTYVINNITYTGHQYLDSIKDKSIWEKTKEIIQSKGMKFTFDVIQAVAIAYAKDLLGL